MQHADAAAPAVRSETTLAEAARRATDAVFLATVFSVTFTKLRWESAGGLVLPDALTALLVVALVLERLLHRERCIPRIAFRTVLMGGLLVAVYSTGFLAATDIAGGPQQVVKGLTRLALHFALLAGGVTYLAWRPRNYLMRAAACLTAGVSASALYALAQFVLHESGRNLDAFVVSPLTGQPARTLIFGLNKSPDVPRLTGMTSDPDHLAIMLIVPILLVLPLYLQLRSGDRRVVPRALLLSTLLLVVAGTFSRSGLLGMVTGAVVVAVPYRQRLWSLRFLGPPAAVIVVLLALAATNPVRSVRVLTSRVRVDRVSMSHVHQYEFLTPSLRTSAAFGIGLENFGRRYAPITGRENFGPHSFYLQSLAETGIVGTFAFSLFLTYIVVMLRAGARAARDPTEKALVVGLAAVLVGTMAANAFYLTMTFYYFYAVLILVFAVHRPDPAVTP